MNMISQTSYPEIRDTLQSGDIVLFSGNGIISKMIQRVSGSKWSHVGIVYRPGHDAFILESTMQYGQGGVGLSLLSRRIKGYDGEVAIRQAKWTSPESSTRHIGRMMRAHKGKPYENKLFELAMSAIDNIPGLPENEPDYSSLFCSELVAMAVGTIMPSAIQKSPNEFTPGDFADLDLYWLNGIIDIIPEEPDGG